MASDLLGISISGLRYSQTALSTTGHNIANAGTEGYSRQTVRGVTNPATFQGVGYIGNGVAVDSINRVVDDFVVQQLRTDSSLFHSLDTYNSQMSQMNGLLSNEATGLAGALGSFFDAVQNGANDPTSIPARQLILSEAENLADRFNTLHGRFQSLHRNAEGAMEVAVSHVNALTSNIAELNRKIAEATGTGTSPNDLLDKRDEALRELSGLVNIRTLEQDDGQINVIAGKGQSLVIGNQSRKLDLAANPNDPNRSDVVIQGQPPQVITQSIEGGELGGLIDFRDGPLDKAFNDLGRVAVVLSDSFNQVHQQGITLDNEFGGTFFYDINDPTLADSRVIEHGNNQGDLQMRLNISDSSALEAAEYRVIFDNASDFRVVRTSNNQEVAAGALPVPLDDVEIPGIGLELEFLGGTPQAGDSFRLQPVRSGAQNFAVSIDRPEAIAMASALTTEHAVGNNGTGKIQSAELLDAAAVADLPLVVEFTGVDEYRIFSYADPNNPVELANGLAFTPGMSNAIFSTDVADAHYTGVQAAINGRPEAGDRFTINFNQDGAFDNRNGIALANLQSASTIGGSASYSEGYGALVEEVGIQTSSSRISRNAAEQVLNQTNQLRESISGVNLDEEAANLIRFEQLFSANAQVISVARDLFDRLISSF